MAIPLFQRLLSLINLFTGNLWEDPRSSIIDNIVDQMVEITANVRVHAAQQREDELDEPAFHLTSTVVFYQIDPFVVLPVIHIFKDGIENKAFYINICTACSADDILEFRNLDHFTVPVERVHDDRCRREIESLRQSRR